MATNERLAGRIPPAPLIEQSIANTCREFKVRQLYLFGSLARGEAHDSSDVDRLVEFEIIDRGTRVFEGKAFVDLQHELFYCV